MIDTIADMGAARREMEPWWKLCRSLNGGTLGMREARDAYLPLTEQERRNPGEYQWRLCRSTLFPAYSETTAIIASMPFQKAVKLSGLDAMPDKLRLLETNADRCGNSLTAFAKQIFHDMVDRGMGMFIVDSVPTAAMNVAQAEEADARPYFVRIAPDNYLGYQSRMSYGREVLTEFRYRESVTVVDSVGHEKFVDQVVVWAETTVSKHMRDDFGELKTVSVIEHGYPDGIPLVVCYSNKMGTLFARPPMDGLAWENVAHWQARSDQTAALSYVRHPVLAGSNLSRDTAEASVRLGPGANVKDTGDAHWEFVEISGSSLAAGEVEIDKIESRMRQLGMAPLVEGSATTTATGENRAEVRQQSASQSWAEALEWGLFDGIRMAHVWIAAPMAESVDVAVFREFAMTARRATDIAAWQADAREGRVSLRTYLSMVQQDLYRDQIDPDEEIAAIGEEKDAASERFLQGQASRIIGERDGGGDDPPVDGDQGGAQ